MITIVNYGCGNVRAIVNVYASLRMPVNVTSDPSEVRRARKLILPGVGAFDGVMDRLESSDLRSVLDELVLSRGIPVLGICVGMQIMADGSEEGSMPGLGWISGRVRRFDPSTGCLLPHMGWNDVDTTRATPLFAEMDQDARFYFLHSYYFECAETESILAQSEYSGRFTCAVQAGNVYGVQFHPEKSHRFGVQLLKNFASL